MPIIFHSPGSSPYMSDRERDGEQIQRRCVPRTLLRNVCNKKWIVIHCTPRKPLRNWLNEKRTTQCESEKRQGSRRFLGFEKARLKIAQKYNEIEKALIAEFVRAHHEGDKETMRQVAAVLSHFKDYEYFLLKMTELDVDIEEF
ncbi:hypothetical protein HPB51_006583 [Rhipicephalus microplus]|uniref:Exocyst complex component Sec10-like alpha-helical bundle domain-containing protein n=1 Tax=Rhipicephalus microplus TaxID=6941 RepID=A0A9J6E6Q4_RHIMP|nr:hypothetical protein HPB51_006583 [Rhipicephalus microplus]